MGRMVEMVQMESEMEENIVCAGCGQEFIYTEREKKFLEDLVKEGKLEEVKTPRRCLVCRSERRRSKQAPRALPAPAPTLLSVPAPALRAPLPMPAPMPVLPPAVTIPVIPPFKEGSVPGTPCPDELVILVASDFEQLVCREEVLWRQGNRKIRIRLADIGPEAMKKAMERGLIRWWKS